MDTLSLLGETKPVGARKGERDCLEKYILLRFANVGIPALTITGGIMDTQEDVAGVSANNTE